MAVSDTMFLLAFGFIFNTLVMYKKNRFFGNIGYIAISLATILYINTDAGNAIGFIMLLASFANMVYDSMKKIDDHQQSIQN